MMGPLSLRFVAAEDLTCPLARVRLSRRQAAGSCYAFDRAGIARLVIGIVEASATLSRPGHVDLVEVYTANRYCAAVELHATKTVILDYGFIELLADNIALEYLDNATTRQLRDWFAAGQPEDFGSEGVNMFEADGGAHHITGTMMLRDVACKFLDDIEPDRGKRERLADSLLWRTDDGLRPNDIVYASFQGPRRSLDVLPAFVGGQRESASLADQVALATAFVACHEIAHLAWSREEQSAWRGSDFARQVSSICNSLCAIPLEEPEGALLGHLTMAARRDEEVFERVVSEAFIDFRALDMLMAQQRRDGRRQQDWAPYLANLFALVAMTNSLGIFRSHMVSAILERSIATERLHLARSEAVMRNLLVLAFLEQRHQELAGAAPAERLLPLIDSEWMNLERRMIYFALDLTAGRSEEEWTELIASVLG
jgi:hypothetical protein